MERRGHHPLVAAVDEPFAGPGQLGFRAAPASCGSCSAVKSWHQKWKDLDADAIGSPAYNMPLEAITRASSEIAVT